MYFIKIALLVVCVTYTLCSRDVEVKSEEDLGVKYASRCEVCKILATELQSRLEETGKVHDVIEIGYSLDDVQPKKKTKYHKSELRLIETLDGVCNRILEYNIHKEREDSTRFAKGISQTFKTLHGLVDKGVKVDLGIPYELWDKPSAEITHMKTQCESLLEDNEEAIEHWYWNLQGTKDLKLHLCTDHALKNTDNSCLFEEQNTKGDSDRVTDSNNKNNNNNVNNESVQSSKLKEQLEIPEQQESIVNNYSKRANAGWFDVDSDDDDVDDEFFEDINADIEYEELQRQEQDFMDSADRLKLRNKNIQEGLSNEPDIKKFKNNPKRGEFGDSYWTEPTEYVKRQKLEEEKLKTEHEMAEPESNEKITNSEEREEL